MVVLISFRRFSCTGAATLVDDVDLSNLDSITAESGIEEDGLSTGKSSLISISF